MSAQRQLINHAPDNIEPKGNLTNLSDYPETNRKNSPMSYPEFNRLLENNKRWSKSKSLSDASFFTESAKGQAPRYLWLGCIDSRVPAELVCGLEPGEMFTHRNIANQFLDGDTSANAVIEFSVGVLQVPHVIVCGHTACGGVKAAIAQAKGISGSDTNLSQWITSLQVLYSQHESKLQSMSDEEQANQLAVLSVAAQIEKIAATQTVQNAWRDGQPLAIHGVLFDLATGQLQDLGLSRDH